MTQNITTHDHPTTNPQIPIGWEEVELGNVVEINTETVKSTNKNLKIKYIDIASVECGQINQIPELEIKDAPSRAKRIVKDNCILISTVRPNLRHYCFVKNSQENLIASTGFAVIETKKADPKFIYYFITTDDYTEHLTKIADGHTATYPSFNPDVIQKSLILLPPLPEQQAIASILSSLDDKIELLRDQNKTLEDLGQKLFQKELTENGNSWEEMRMGEVCGISSGKNVKKDEYVTNGIYPIYGANGIIGKTNKFLFDEQLIITGRVGTLGNVFIVQDKVWYSDNTLIFRPNIPQSFYWIYFNLLKVDFVGLNRGSTQPLITQGDLLKTEILIPDETTLAKFHDIVAPIFSKILANTQQIQTLSKIRDTLLPQLMSGRVRVGVECNI